MLTGKRICIQFSILWAGPNILSCNLLLNGKKTKTNNSNHLDFKYNGGSNGGYLSSAADVSNIDFTGQHRSITNNTITTKTIIFLKKMRFLVLHI